MTAEHIIRYISAQKWEEAAPVCSNDRERHTGFLPEFYAG
jgi:hypothetical protein